MYRRIVTDGHVFRVQFRTSSVSEWGFYPQMHVTQELAQQELDELVDKDAREEASRWTVVEPRI